MIDDDGTKVRVICGSVWGATSPVDGIATDPHYIDVSIPPNTKKRIPIETQRHAFAYVFAGAGQFLDASDPRAAPTEWADVDNGEAMLEGEATGTPAVHAGNRYWCFSTAVTRSLCSRVRRGSVSCSCPANPCRNLSPGMGRSS